MFSAREATLRQIFDSGEYGQFIIPAYQRSYVWGQDELENFWNDFALRQEGQGQLHLIGALIISKSETTKEFGVVDGQQRLITTSIFITALRDVWGVNFGFAEQDYYNLERFVLRSERQKGTAIKVKVADTIRTVYESLVVAKQIPKKVSTADEKALLGAYKFFLQKMEDIISNPGVTEAQKRDMLWDKLENVFSTNTVIITLEDEDDAYEVFEGFNARGVELSIADLFKNLIIQKVGNTPESKDKALAKWNEINQVIRDLNIRKFNINTFLRYFWIRNHNYIGEKELYRRIKKDTDKNEYGKLLNDLYSMSQDMKILFSENTWDIRELLGGKQSYSSDVNDSLRALRVMNTQSYMVWLMSIVDQNARKQIEPKWIAAALKQVEVFSFRYFGVSKLPANRIEKIYAKLSKHLFILARDKDASRLSTHVNNSLKTVVEKEKLLPAKEQFMLDFEGITLQSNNKPFIRYMLTGIEHARGTSEKRVDQFTVNLEHILPQKPGQAWGVTPLELKESVNRLGNLTILHEKINSTMSNKPIGDKVELLKDSDIVINKEIIEIVDNNDGNWGPAQIGHRQSMLGEQADEAWRL